MITRRFFIIAAVMVMASCAGKKIEVDFLGPLQGENSGQPGFARTLLCDFEKHPTGKVGVRGYRFGDVVCDILAGESTIEVQSNRPFTLFADGRFFNVEAGRNSFTRL